MKFMFLLKRSITVFLVLLFLFFTLHQTSFAHEAYVLTKQQFTDGMKIENLSALDAFKNPENTLIFLQISILATVLIIAGLVIRVTKFGEIADTFFSSFKSLAPVVVRVAIGASLLFSGLSGSFLGPELSLHDMPFSLLLQILLAAQGIMLLLGLYTEIAALLVLLFFILGLFSFGMYLFTYVNYFGELLVLALFGSRMFSVDRTFFGPLKRFKNIAKYETTIVRVCYGVALIFAAINVKFLHPTLTVTVVKEYRLTQFHWLFPQDPLLVTFGAALAELFVGLFILIGFEVRLTVFISLFYITLSLLYFKEAVWPHLMLYGVSLSLLAYSGRLTLDSVVTKLLVASGVKQPQKKKKRK